MSDLFGFFVCATFIINYIIIFFIDKRIDRIFAIVEYQSEVIKTLIKEVLKNNENE